MVLRYQKFYIISLLVAMHSRVFFASDPNKVQQNYRGTLLGGIIANTSQPSPSSSVHKAPKQPSTTQTSSVLRDWVKGVTEGQQAKKAELDRAWTKRQDEMQSAEDKKLFPDPIFQNLFIKEFYNWRARSPLVVLNTSSSEEIKKINDELKNASPEDVENVWRKFGYYDEYKKEEKILRELMVAIVDPYCVMHFGKLVNENSPEYDEMYEIYKKFVRINNNNFPLQSIPFNIKQDWKSLYPLLQDRMEILWFAIRQGRTDLAQELMHQDTELVSVKLRHSKNLLILQGLTESELKKYDDQNLFEKDFIDYLTTLHLACKEGKIAIAKNILDDPTGHSLVNIANTQGDVPLHDAASISPRLTSTLLNCGADPNISNNYGILPIENAVIADQSECVELLVNAGSQYRNIKPPLIQQAVQAGSYRVLEPLLNLPDIDITTSGPLNLLEIAYKQYEPYLDQSLLDDDKVADKAFQAYDLLLQVLSVCREVKVADDGNSLSLGKVITISKDVAFQIPAFQGYFPQDDSNPKQSSHKDAKDTKDTMVEMIKSWIQFKKL